MGKVLRFEFQVPDPEQALSIILKLLVGNLKKCRDNMTIW
ncbi:hypothetical protein MGA3_07700 [Bacillus methanolicus MGA3]|uniref:Uncharacterized protein n=1 Tax=Bacillus methanolicus (strain MGA3 / ATCC 53907) TaxID=796606 RepID=I3E9B9_BACMM|nr:hypothetical protein BMMGA3_09710 [Bacillus methanolicus MGA3]EIJ83090.1 hypothetical protein MGA3_07700 [Bacillus methanolicus MGA3]